MKVYEDKLYLVVVQLLDNETHKDEIKVFPCKTLSSAQEFENYYRKNTEEGKLGSVDIIESNVYGD